jgi:hypothetical protein
MDTQSRQMAEIHAAQRFHLRATAVMVFIIYWLVVLTYQDFFFFNPADEPQLARQISLWLCLMGWVLAALGSPLALLGAAGGSLVALRVLPVTALWWPVSLLISQVTLFVITGNAYMDYLFQYPIFIVTDIALPVLVVMKWSRMKAAVDSAGMAQSDSLVRDLGHDIDQ